MSGFEKNWNYSRKTPVSERIKEAVRNDPLRARLEEARRRISSQIKLLDGRLQSLKQRDKTLFKKAVSHIQKHEMDQAKAITNEIQEIRKITKMVEGLKLVLERTEMRLRTVEDLGDAVATLAPVGGVIRSVKKELVKVVPEAGMEMDALTQSISGFVTEFTNLSGFTINFEAMSEEAEKILAEAESVAEARMGDELPPLPPLKDES
ncbi:MAG: hypothetical protein J7K45_04385 [Thaumarchaeota archaeon]|nr:hypothetical protein [Nitrososphaerota archaeon]